MKQFYSAPKIQQTCKKWFPNTYLDKRVKVLEVSIFIGHENAFILYGIELTLLIYNNALALDNVAKAAFSPLL